MGARGPVPKRSSERRRRNKESEVETISPLSRTVEAPKPKAGWSAVMKDWYVALTESSQAQFYEPSDWAEARIWCDVMTRALKAQRPVSAHLLAAFSGFSARLLTTEGDRRRVRLEIERDVPEPAAVVNLAAFRSRAGA